MPLRNDNKATRRCQLVTNWGHSFRPTISWVVTDPTRWPIMSEGRRKRGQKRQETSPREQLAWKLSDRLNEGDAHKSLGSSDGNRRPSEKTGGKGGGSAAGSLENDKCRRLPFRCTYPATVMPGSGWSDKR